MRTHVPALALAVMSLIPCLARAQAAPPAPLPPSPVPEGVVVVVPPEGTIVPVRFEMEDPTEIYEVTVELPGEPSCRLPCELLVPSGKQTFEFAGAKTFEKRLRIPRERSVVRVVVRSTPRMAAGIATAAVGGIACILTMFVAIGLNGGTSGDFPVIGHVGGQELKTALRVGFLAGPALVGVGIVGGVATNLTRASLTVDPESTTSEWARLLGLSMSSDGKGGGSLGLAFAF